jgi:hypothetical protein
MLRRRCHEHMRGAVSKNEKEMCGLVSMLEQAESWLMLDKLT